LGNERRAIDLQLQIAQRMRQGEKTLNWSVIDFNIASAYFDLGDYPNARIYVARSRQVAEDLADDVGVAYANELMAKIALEELQWESAISLASQAAEVFANSADSEKRADALITLASAYTLRGGLDNADAVITQLE
jgi:tetratricopeptide (TPR) repeat protein